MNQQAASTYPQYRGQKKSSPMATGETSGAGAADFGATVRGLRVKERLSRDDLAARAEISLDYLRSIETGRTSPAYSTIRRLADALEVSPSVLVGEDWGTCLTCLYWAATSPRGDSAKACLKIAHSLSADKSHDPAWMEDADDFVAILYTKPSFGCRLWRERAGDEEEDP